jgi:ATP-dependent DNA helicase RecQ
MDQIIKDRVSKIIGDIDKENSIIVLKGIDIKLFYDISIDLNKILDNKLSYLFSIVKSGRIMILYDEYLALYNLITEQYKNIYIIDNNLYLNYYPLNISIEENQLHGLLNHYNDELEGDNVIIGDIQELTNIYGNLISINNKYFITYNQIISHEKEKIVKLFECDPSYKPVSKEYSDHIDVLELVDELDYVKFLERLFRRDISCIQIVDKNIGISNQVLYEKLSIINSGIFSGIDIILVKVSSDKGDRFVHLALVKILKKYWNTDKFRELDVYDISAIENNEKKLIRIKQSDIITSIVEEVEKCKNGEDFRDIFVTAPTGAGKSAMFQIPAIYLAEKYELFTIVISPLIGLMKDQVNNLESRGYPYSRTINSDISPVKKQEIIDDIAEKRCHILYISPESLMSKSDLVQLIGDRTLGLFVIDEAHIVTTWGKQFRPDYWYLGDHVDKLRKVQEKRNGMQFLVATFTATAIYGGLENMYKETIQSLHMIDPITYLGYIRRKDINIRIEKSPLITGRTEYELEKFENMLDQIKRAIITSKKMLIYFPTVALIERFYQYCLVKDLGDVVTKYHGKLDGYIKENNYYQFLNRERLVMLATKAFGMGIDIDDIEIVVHFAPTGNVCDYIQEVGRAARKPSLRGEAFYKFMSNDFKHINRLHGLSTIKKYQLVEVIRKVYQLYQQNISSKRIETKTKRRNEMLVDAESFAHIFENPFFSEDDGINKVKTAMLLIQKDFERTYSFSPFHIRPIPLFEIGYFMINKEVQAKINSKYGSIVNELDTEKHICDVNLKRIWEKDFADIYSFPKFKYMLYSKEDELRFLFKNNLSPALKIDIFFTDNHISVFNNIIKSLKQIFNKAIREGTFYSEDELTEKLLSVSSVNKYRAKNIIEVLISSMMLYQKDFLNSLSARIYSAKPLKNGNIKYRFSNVVNSYFKWIEKSFTYIIESVVDNVMYLIEENGNKIFKEFLLILGILESFEVLTFKALGGKNSQLYIYVNQTKTMREIIEKPQFYSNKLLDLVGERHELSVQMLTYLFENDFNSEEIWDYIEDYFLGIIPEKVIENYEKKTGKKLDIY